MTVKRKTRRKEKQVPSRRLTTIELRAISFGLTITLGGLAIVLDVREPVVWAFLNTAIGVALGQAFQGNSRQ